MVVIAIGRIACTYFTFCQTYDEPAHISRGTAWLTGASYLYPLHPPLAPIAFAAGPKLSGIDIAPTGNRWADGNAILYARNYRHTLMLARMGNLPFFILAAVAIWMWCREYYDLPCALAALFIFTMLPPVLAHAGLATTDMAITATVCTSTWLFLRWLDKCTLNRSLALGIAVGLTILTKLSAVVFLPTCLIAALLARSPTGEQWSYRQRMIHCGVVLVTGYYILYGGYRFSFGPVYQADALVADGSGVPTRIVDSSPIVRRLLEIPIPAPEFFRGLTILIDENKRGHAPYFLGSVNQPGNIAFFPVVLAVKTPISFFIAFFIGVFAAFRRTSDRHELVPLACFFAILGVALMARINLGVRHILPIYPLLSIGAGLGVCRLWHSRDRTPFTSSLEASTTASYSPSQVPLGRVAVAVLGIYGATSSALAHPDYLAYFNEFGSRHPENIVVDSDMDWGQDLDRLAAELQLRNADHVYLAYFGTAEPRQHRLPEFEILPAHQRVHGYVAISLTTLKTNKGYFWLEDHEPVARVGKSILLFIIPIRSQELQDSAPSRKIGMACDALPRSW